jgi:hypothetical protein
MFNKKEKKIEEERKSISLTPEESISMSEEKSKEFEKKSSEKKEELSNTEIKEIEDKSEEVTFDKEIVLALQNHESRLKDIEAALFRLRSSI